MALLEAERNSCAQRRRDVHLALHVRVQHSQDEVDAGDRVVLADAFSLGGPAHRGIHDQDVAVLDDLPERKLDRMVEEVPQRGNADDAADLVARRPEALSRQRRSCLQKVGDLAIPVFAGLVQGRRVERADRRDDLFANIGADRRHQRVDVLERRALVSRGCAGERADGGVIEHVARGLEDLALVNVEKALDDVVGNTRDGARELARVAHRLRRQPQRRKAEPRIGEVQKPDALAAVGRQQRKRETGDFALGVDEDRCAVRVAAVVEERPQQKAGLAGPLSTDDERALDSIGWVLRDLGVGRLKRRHQPMRERRMIAIDHALIAGEAHQRHERLVLGGIARVDGALVELVVVAAVDVRG